MVQEWRVIEEFPTYSVSNLGQIRNDQRNNILTGGHDKDGYRQVTICYRNKQYSRRICRLVGKAFLPNPNNYPCINHIDENKENDKVTNLEWCTYKYNNNYGQKGSVNGRRVKCVETGKIYKSTREAERQTGIYHSYVSYSARFHKKCGGYHWEYI